jgi:hypothetical protein
LLAAENIPVARAPARHRPADRELARSVHILNGMTKDEAERWLADEIEFAASLAVS